MDKNNNENKDTEDYVYIKPKENSLNITSTILNTILNINECAPSLKDWKVNNNGEYSMEVQTFLKTTCDSEKVECETSTLVGPLLVEKEVMSLEWLKANDLNFVQPGGWWTPTDCLSRNQVAIIIPFRQREEHLTILLRQLIPILKRQNLHYRVFVIEQNDDNNFNRGKLMNVGYQEALSYFPYNCFVFHDVDLIPENDRIDYGCKSSPAHLSVAVDKFRYQLPYDNIFGGVGMLNKDHFKQINGFSNIFWFWGGEDDNLSFRLKKNGLEIHRQSLETARYTMIKHVESTEIKEAHELKVFMQDIEKYAEKDGLNSLYYDVKSTEINDLFTLIKVDLRKDKDITF
ncbi:beta-1,4-N-acetylgalactosaminyltransferase bre-4 isoform X1 [Hydra vulgaris]|uniref:beta-1,4-N-acetylgalactosaminyltransferase bre-4 isoform X1 n=1 Tax=Hydra vulgaris TaxID=6087 RepID=UPI001F5EA3ED|nr:beta-1,4-N-acetylgalactosaminyltransferase bre-4 [Hydra vulgaris]